MNILLTGASGQLGQELIPQLRSLGPVTRVDKSVQPGDRETLKQDLGDLNRVEIMLNRARPDIIVNAAAYTAVDQAENESESAFRLNAELPGCLARWAQRNDRFLLHYSTDYVFPGDSERPYLEDDQTGPLNVYGDSKLAGEWAISASECRHAILRTSWVYSGHGNNFVLTMLRLARTRPSLNIVGDQIGCPTWARSLARVSRTVIDRVAASEPGNEPHGIYHYCDDGVVSWYDFAHAIFTAAQAAGLLHELPAMTAVRTLDYPQLAQRPMFSVLNTHSIQETFDIIPATLEASLKTCIEEMTENE
jgi:dTDP-4-dehydrorhamnose reductase